MKINELFDKTEDLGRVVALSEEFHAFKTIGGREIRFSASVISEGCWEVEFAEQGEEDPYGATMTSHSMTGKGHEFEVMSFVMGCVKRVIEKYSPPQIEFMAKSNDESRVSLYRKLLKRFARDYNVRESEMGMDADDKFKHFKLTKKTNEGMMKRSDPWISGERSDERPKPAAPKKPSAHDTKIKNLAAKANVSPEKVERIWSDVKRELDMNHPNSYAILMARVKRVLGITS
jgi:hypothetical protein